MQTWPDNTLHATLPQDKTESEDAPLPPLDLDMQDSSSSSVLDTTSASLTSVSSLVHEWFSSN